MTTPLIYRPEPAALAGLKAAVLAGVRPGGAPIRVDVDVVEGDLASPMCLLEHTATRHDRGEMTRAEYCVWVDVQATFIATAVDLARQLRARALYEVAGRDGHGRFWSPLTVTGFVVVDRQAPDSLPGVQFGGGWANAALPVSLLLEPAS